MEGIKDWTKKKMVEEDWEVEQSKNYQKIKIKIRIRIRINKHQQSIRKDAKDVVHKELYKIYYKTSIIIYSIDTLDIVFGFKFFIDFII